MIKEEVYTKLPPEFKTKWIKALRSGKYPQGVGALKTTIGYCCVGVAGAVCGVPDELLLSHLLFVDEGIFCYEKGELNNLIEKYKIPREIIGSANPMAKGNDRNDYNPILKKLVEMNDSGKSFIEIADWIEENL